MNKVVKVYKFEELSPEVRANVRAQAEEVLVEARAELLEETLCEQLAETYCIHLGGGALFYSLSHCQGDGVSFSMYNMQNSDYFIREAKERISSPAKLQMLHDLLSRDAFEVMSCHSSRYYGASTSQVGYTLAVEVTKEEGELIAEVTQEIARLYVALCANLERDGYSLLTVSAEEVIYYCQYGYDEGEHLYFEDGTIADRYIVSEQTAE